jgi:type II secretory pathway pseudopilin PulG
MAVVAIIGMLAAVALPGIADRLTDSRGNSAAQGYAMFFRHARARAMGRGSAHLVRFRTSAPSLAQGELLMYEAVQPQNTGTGLGVCGFLPPTGTNSCLANPQGGSIWPVVSDNGDTPPAAAARSRFVTRSGQYLPHYEEFYATLRLGTTFFSPADICFTPTGRTYFAATGQPLQALTSVLDLEVMRGKGFVPTPSTAIGIIRQVIIPPNGVPRLRL